MIRSVMQKLIFYMRENALCCIICAAALICGAMIGIAWAVSMPELDAKELSLYFADFFASFVQAGTDSAVIFTDALRLQAYFFGILLLCSGMIFGLPFIFIVGVGSGISVGFTATFLLKNYGMRALLFMLTGMLPHTLLMLPCHFAALCVCVQFSVLLLKERAGLKNRLISHFLILCALFAVAFAAVLLQAYIEPLLVSMIAPYFVS